MIPIFNNDARRKIIVLSMLCAMFGNAYAGVKIEHWKTQNNVPIYFVPLPELPMIDIKLQFRAGASHDDKLPGIASMTTALLRTGAKGMDVVAINEAFDSIGARFATGAGYDGISVSLRSLTEKQYLNKGLQTFLHVLSQPTFPLDEIELNRKKALLNIRAVKEKPGNVANQHFRENIYSGHVYEHAVIGKEESVKRITAEDIRRYYNTYFVTENLVITAVGAVSRQEFETIAERIANSLPKGKKAKPVEPVPPLQEAKEVYVPFPSQQAHIKIGQPLIEAGNPDFFALYLGNHILGGSGFGSRLLEEIRVKRGLAYSSSSYFNTRVAAGPFTIGFQTQINQTRKATKVAFETLNEFVEKGPTDKEIKLSIESIRNNFALRMTSNRSIHNAIGKIAFHELGIDYFDYYLEQFNHLDADKVLAALQKHLHPEKMVTVIVGGNKLRN